MVSIGPASDGILETVGSGKGQPGVESRGLILERAGSIKSYEENEMKANADPITAQDILAEARTSSRRAGVIPPPRCFMAGFMH